MSFFTDSDESSLRDAIAKWLQEKCPEKTRMLFDQHPGAVTMITQGMSVCAIQNGNLLADAFVPEETSLDENGCIPAHTTCPFKARCEIASCCNHQGVLHDKPYSCAAARSHSAVMAAEKGLDALPDNFVKSVIGTIHHRGK